MTFIDDFISHFYYVNKICLPLNQIDFCLDYPLVDQEDYKTKSEFNIW